MEILKNIPPYEIWNKIISSYNKNLERYIITFETSYNIYYRLIEKLLYDIKNKNPGLLINLSSYYLLTIWKKKPFIEAGKLYYIEDTVCSNKYIINNFRDAIIIALEIFFKNSSLSVYYNVFVWEYNLSNRIKIQKEFDCKNTLKRITGSISMCGK